MARGIVYTVLYALCFFALGLIIGSLGPTLPALASLMNSSEASLGFVFTARGLGYLGSSSFAGVMYSRAANVHLVLGGFLLVAAFFMVLVPMVASTGSHVGIGFIFVFVGWGSGALDVGINTFISWVHGAAVGPHIQACHFGFGVGAFSSPVIAERMMSTLSHHSTHVQVSWVYYAFAIICSACVLGVCLLRGPSDPGEGTDESDTPAGGDKSSEDLPGQPAGHASEAKRLLVVQADSSELVPDSDMSVELVVVGNGTHSTDGGSDQSEESDPVHSELVPVETDRNSEDIMKGSSDSTDALVAIPRDLTIVMSLVLFAYVGMEVAYGGWVTTYGLKEDFANESAAPYLNAAFWGTLTLSRLMGVVLSARYPPLVLLLRLSLAAVLALIPMLVYPSTGSVWITSALYGLSLGPVYASVMTVPSSLGMRMTNQVSAWLVIGGAVGEMLIPAAVAPLFHAVGYHVFPWWIVAVAFTHWLLIVYLNRLAGGYRSRGQQLVEED